MNRVYEKLKNNRNFEDKLKFDESKNCLTIIFNEYLRLDYFEGDYNTILDEGLILLNSHLPHWTAHWHISDDEEALEVITDFAKGDEVYIEDLRWYAFLKMRIIRKEQFEKKKEKYIKKKFLRIYSATEVICRGEKNYFKFK